ncbi:hypothetical protein IDAT_02215 [Pseudidiomarina atlantica]|uniref:HTH cro/C1-type domain-containing protein n=1 Tax=Pseudidiomarina atlantica TaxID=1517416 RepID=A0A094L5F5_9GAMM|nr:helix-turn-helix transcriptional regulator [Pseudidiomarina atlantica]KFZ29923.1 hypothetical protein IDAT_02215 [Pseudidiomarina atlantica]
MLNNRPIQPYMRRKLAQSFAINVGYLIQHKRASAGLDQTDLALLVETSRSTISRIERGKSVASETVLAVLAELEMLEHAAVEVESMADGKRFYQRKVSGPRSAEKLKKWQEFQRYWLGDSGE